MNFFTKIRATSWLIGLLVILNILTLGALWFQQFRPPPGMLPPSGKPAENMQRFLQQELNLTEPQVQQFETLRKQFFLKSRTLMQEIFQLRKEIADNLFSASPDAQKAATLAQEIGAKQGELERLQFTHFLELKAVCQPAQQQKFQVLMRDLLERMKPPEPPQPPGEGRSDARGMPPPDGPRKQPPQEAVAACNGKHVGDVCEFVMLRGEKMTGNCQTVQNLRACLPEGCPPPGEPRPEGPPPEDPPPGN